MKAKESAFPFCLLQGTRDGGLATSGVHIGLTKLEFLSGEMVPKIYGSNPDKSDEWICKRAIELSAELLKQFDERS